MREKRYWLREIRERNGMTQQNVANAVGISRVRYNQIENLSTNVNPSQKTIEGIARVLGFEKEKFV